MIKEVSIYDISPFIESALNSGNDVKLSVTGNSMFPTLRGGVDSVCLTKAPDKIKKYDIPLYRRENGEYILHRIIKCKGDLFYANGDNQYTVEKDIDFSSVLGVVKEIYRGKKTISCSSVRYRIYSRFWVAVRPFRGFFIKLYLKTIRRFKRRKK